MKYRVRKETDEMNAPASKKYVITPMAHTSTDLSYPAAGCTMARSDQLMHGTRDVEMLTVSEHFRCHVLSYCLSVRNEHCTEHTN